MQAGGCRVRGLAVLITVQTLLLCGCASTGRVSTLRGQPPPGFVERFSTARSGDTVYIRWPSRVGEVYRVFFNDGGRQWIALPQAALIPGNGSTLTVRDRVPPGVQRRYRIQVRQAAASPRR